MRLFLIRHAPTSGNEQRRYVGARTDEPLSERGRAAAAALACTRVRRVLAAEALRTRETARLLFPEADVTAIEGIGELDFGAFEGRTAAELEGDLRYRAWVEGGCTDACPGGEAPEAYVERVCATLSAQLLAAHARGEREVVCVCHAGTIMAAGVGLTGEGDLRDLFSWHVRHLEALEAEVRCEGGTVTLTHPRRLEADTWRRALSQGTLTGVGVGPGDPHLLTLAAVRSIEAAGVVCLAGRDAAHSRALAAAARYVQGKELLFLGLSMRGGDQELRSLERAAARVGALLDEGRDVCYLCLGDVSLYGSFYRLVDALGRADRRIEVVCGVSSITAAAARLQVPLAQGDERLLVAPAKTLTDCDGQSVADALVVLKASGDLTRLKETLAAHGRLGRAVLVSNLGHEDERISRLADAREAPYLSLVLVRAPGGDA